MKKIIAFILLLCSCTTHSTVRATAINFSRAQIEDLAREVMTHTPDHTHYAGYKFNWVLFTRPEKDPYPAITEKIRSQLKKKYIVYDKQNELPAESISYDTNDPVGAPIYYKGFGFSIEINRLDQNTIEVKYNDFENSMAGGSQTIRYRWQRNRWKAIWKSNLIVA